VDKKKCVQYNRNTLRNCRRNATTVTPWGDACDKCAVVVATSILSRHPLPGDLTVWAIREIVRQEMKRG
jgi:hypothetical protein